ncbi:MAG: SxtJ family membrane protein [Nitrospinota bacterium]
MQGIVRFFKLLYKGWMVFAHALGWVNTRILLVLFFFFVITPAAILARLMGKDLLSQRLDPGAETYWVPKEGEAFDPKSYLRQF